MDLYQLKYFLEAARQLLPLQLKALEHKQVLVGEPQGRSAGLAVLRDAIRLYEREKDRLRGTKEPPAARERRPARRRTRR